MTGANLISIFFCIKHFFYAFTGAVSFVLCYGKHNVDFQPASRCGCVIVLIDRFPRHVVSFKDFLHLVIFTDVAKPPVQFCDKNNVYLITLYSFQQLKHGRALFDLLSGRKPGILKNAYHLHIVGFGVFFEVVLLIVNRQAKLFLFFCGHTRV